MPGQRMEPLPRQDILEIDLVSRRLRVLGTVTSDYPGLFLRSNRDGSRMLALERQRTRVSLRDGRTGSLITQLPQIGKVFNAMSLDDSGVATLTASREFNRKTGVATPIHGPATLLAAFGATGAERFRLSRSVAGGILEGQPTAETLLLSSNPSPPNDATWLVEHIDMRTGRVLRTMKGLVPIAPMRFWHLATLPPSRAGVRDYDFFDREGNVVRIDIIGGTRTVVIRPSELR